MKSREDHIAFDMNYCEHYAPQPGSLKKDYCALNLGAQKAMDRGRESGEKNMTPCIGGHTCQDATTLCPKWVRRSREHAEKRADAIEQMFKQMEIGMPFINEWRKKEPFGKQEVVPCPVCKGSLHLSQSSYNGHVHAHCETPYCLNFME